MTIVEAPSRLHFGLLSVPVGEQAGRTFGGVGLMLERPRVVVQVELAERWIAAGPDAERALQAGQRFCESLAVPDVFSINVIESPEPHSGLGSGTTLSQSVARAIASETGHGYLSACELARHVGRGKRSAIGIHGFAHGGLIIEHGKLPGEVIAPLVHHRPLPDSWRIVLARPAIESAWHGDRESNAFGTAQVGNPRKAMLRLVEQSMLPALNREDVNAFGEAVRQFNRLAGVAFQQAQGGPYAHPAIEQLIDTIRHAGIPGAGQSSWGPTVFAIVGNEDKANDLVDMLRALGVNSQITRPAVAGARTTAEKCNR